jgi:hypothetical protein
LFTELQDLVLDDPPVGVLTVKESQHLDTVFLAPQKRQNFKFPGDILSDLHDALKSHLLSSVEVLGQEDVAECSTA